MPAYRLSVPASSANIGPGFDVLGIGLALYLQLTVTIEDSPAPTPQVTLTYSGEGADDVPLDHEANLITRTALYVLRCHGIRQFPNPTTIHVDNPIPLGRGLGSSGAAVVAGVMLGNVVGNLQLSKPRMLDFCLMIERHPDNISAAMMGGFVGLFLRELTEGETSPVEIPLAEVLPEPAGGVDTGATPPMPPVAIGQHIKYGWAPEIKCVCVVPQFEVLTAKSRAVLPQEYSRADIVFNLQRIAVLTTALTHSPVDRERIYMAMQDKLHQKYRAPLIPGLTDVLEQVTMKEVDGLCGICLSGAGPTILALAVGNFDQISDKIVNVFKTHGVECKVMVLDLADGGATTEEL